MLTATSFVLTAAVLGNAYVQKKQFYPSVVYITKSHPSLAVSILPLFIVWSSAYKFVYGADADDVQHPEQYRSCRPETEERNLERGRL